MEAYIYDADVYCEVCGRAIRERLTKAGQAPADPANERSYDSGEFPKGPYSDGSGEADCPQNCGGCGLFLLNPLTPDGVEYVLEYLDRAVKQGTTTDCEREWAAELADYCLSPADKARLESYHAAFPAPDLSQAKIWVRTGDQSDYNSHAELATAIAEIEGMRPGRLERWRTGGFTAENFRGDNYVSLYYGDAESNYLAELSVAEKFQVNESMELAAQ